MLSAIATFFSFRRPSARLPYLAALAVVLIGFVGPSLVVQEEGGALVVGALLFLPLSWVFLAALCRRLVDAGRTRWWIALPFALSIPVFIGGFILHSPPDPARVLGSKGLADFLNILIPLSGWLIAQVLSRFAVGFMAAVAVWWAFAFVLLLPGSRHHA